MDLFIFNESKDNKLEFNNIIIITVCILLFSQVITMAICKILNIDIEEDIDKNTDKLIKKWHELGLNVYNIIIGEFLGSVLYSPIAEEFVYKFLLIKYLLVNKYGINPFISCFIQSLIFSITHYSNLILTEQNPKFNKIQIINAFVSSFISGIFYIQYNSLIPCILAHIVNNGLASVNDIIKFVNYKNSKDKIK